jgi:hypothetical protein
LKVRWNRPGQGKSGALRLIVLAFCETRHVHIADAALRSDDPSKEEAASAVAHAIGTSFPNK